MINNAAWAIVPAAGIGSRMQADKPKQYLDLDGKTILEHTLQRLASHPQISGIVISIAEDDPWWPEIDTSSMSSLYVVDGGKERADSVLNALIKLAEITESDPWVLVHDAARPCIRHDDLDRMLTELSHDTVGGVLAIPVNDTVKRVGENNEISETVCRQGLWRAMTPQMFRLRRLSQALVHAKERGLNVTDDASAIELTGLKPKIVEGHSDNIKITIPQDLALARLFLQQQAGETS
jgi:2-C-methyl-D-erythritol 4-phosphate cytidylyltransferase